MCNPEAKKLNVEDAFAQLRQVMTRDVEDRSIQLDARSAALDRRERAVDEREEALKRREQALQASSRVGAGRQSLPAPAVIQPETTSAGPVQKSSLFGKTLSGSSSDAPAPAATQPETTSVGPVQKSNLFGKTLSGSDAIQQGPADAKTDMNQPCEQKPSLFGRSQGQNQAEPVKGVPGSKSSLFGRSQGSLISGPDACAPPAPQQPFTASASPATASASQVPAQLVPDGIDSSCPGSATNLRAKFEKLSTASDGASEVITGTVRRAKSEGRLKFAKSDSAEMSRTRDKAGSSDSVEVSARSASFGQGRSSLFSSCQGKDTDGHRRHSSHDLFSTPSASIDESNPGPASQIRAQFEQSKVKEDSAARKSWKANVASVPLPDGNGSAKVHVGSAVGGSYKPATLFNKPPPERKSLKDLP